MVFRHKNLEYQTADLDFEAGFTTRIVSRSPSYIAAYSLLASTSGCLLISALYLMKSACGINLMAGPSPLHHLFF
ncbi:MAG: hypothetical protein K0U34_07295 [Alphaproteobacteria bacterium]|nr:hypothetical protein [Alphaproteobacteria bacterium]